MAEEPYRILLADDEVSILQFTKAVLAEEGWECVCAENGEAAFERLRAGEFDVLLADCKMPGNEALQLVEKANRLFPGLPVILMAADLSLVPAATSFQPNVFDYLTKPFDAAYLVKRVKQAAEQRRRPQSPRGSEERFRLLFDDAPVGYQCLDWDGRILEVNKMWSETFGHAREEVVGRWFGDFLAPESADVFCRHFPQFRESGVSHNVELEVLRKDGSRVPCSFEGRVARDASGKFLQTHCIVYDISGHKRSEEARRKAETRLHEAKKYESLGVLAGGIAHDFNNILQGILGNASLALMDVDLNSSVAECLREIERAALHASHLTNQMLAYAGKGKFLLQNLDLTRYVKDMEHLLEVNRPKNAALKYALAAGLPVIKADALQIRQLLLNLTTNAYESLGKGKGEVVIATGTEECAHSATAAPGFEDALEAGLYVYVEVKDNGCGMDRHTVSKIFDPFFTTKFTGRGLGLPAALGIARGHKGTIKMSSEPGQGTTVRAFFPAASQPPRAPAPEAGAVPRETKSGAVLLVDDERAVRDVGRRMLQRLGYSVLTAEDGREAVEVFQKHQENVLCVILDLTMPDTDSKSVFEEMRRIRPDVPVLISSGYSETKVEELFSGVEISGFIQKPYLYPGLREKLRVISGGKDQGQSKNVDTPPPPSVG